MLTQIGIGEISYKLTLAGDGNCSGLLGGDDYHRVALLAHAYGGSVAGSELGIEILFLSQRQDAARGNYPAVADDCGAVMEREKRLRGIIFLGGRFDYTPADLALLNVPFVCCSYSNRYGTLTEGEYSSVSIADGDTAQQAVEELYRHGHRRIAALISRPDDQSISQLRYEGYVQALEGHGIPVEPELVISAGGFGVKDAYDAVKASLEAGTDFTALFAIADSMAIGAMRALRDAGRRIPEDCSVIAIDGLELSAYIEPPLTTLCQPMDEMGRRSAEILLDMVQRKGSHACELLPTTLRRGGSVVALQ